MREAREKTAAETAAAELWKSLGQLDDGLGGLRAHREAVMRNVAKSGGLRGLVGRWRGAPPVDAADLTRADASIDAFESVRVSDRQRLRVLEKDSHGAELARAMLGVEMDHRTEAIPSDDPARERLAVISEQREMIVRRYDTAKAVGGLAADLLLWVDRAERADDGSGVIYVELVSASRKYVDLQKFAHHNALEVRAGLKDRLEGFRALQFTEGDYPSLADVAALTVDDHVDAYEGWLRGVRVALDDALDRGARFEASTREQLVELDNERLEILTR